MLLSELADASGDVGNTRSRRKKRETLARFLRRLNPVEAATAVYYLMGRLPQGRVGLGPSTLRHAFRTGAAALPSITIEETDAFFARMAVLQGRGSTAVRQQALTELFARATPPERGFLARLVLCELRQGALDALVLEAAADAAGVDPGAVRRAAMLAGDAALAAIAVLADGEKGLGRWGLRLLAPVSPMLAQSARSIREVLERAGETAFEYKLDGARIQVHKRGAVVRVFTRRLNDATERLPEVVESLSSPDTPDFIIDGEAIALQPNGTPHPFQVTMRRFGRERDVAHIRHQLPVTAFFFDCLHLGGKDLFDCPAEERFAALSSVLAPGLLVPRCVTGDLVEAEAFMEAALRAGHEGVMAKRLDAPYEAGNRGASWLKLKPFHTLDLLVLAAEWGHGRRKGWLSNLHLGARDADGGFVMLGKTFKGLTDRMLQWQTQRLLELELRRDGTVVYVRPGLVVEVAFNDIQRSPVYPGGLALRFARVKRYRPDKGPGEVDDFGTVQTLAARGHSPPSPVKRPGGTSA